MDVVIFIANAWGSVFGGINSYNYDLCQAVAKKRQDKTKRTICLLLTAVNDKIKNQIKESCGLELFSVQDEDVEDYESIEKLPESLSELFKLLRLTKRDKIIWVGHDIKTGFHAIACKNIYGGKCIVIHHMNYKEYYYLATKDSESRNKKIELQEKVILNADCVCAVGPMLKTSAEDILIQSDENADGSSTKVYEISPGLLECIPIKKSLKVHQLIFFGRLDEKNRYIKQPELAISAFANSYKLHRELYENNPSMLVIGYDQITDTDKDRIEKLVKIYTTETLNVVPMKYISKRNKLVNELKKSTICLMVSRHEGFGLAAFEAISAGIPIIISDNTGLNFQLKNKRGKSVIELYTAIHIEGSINEDGKVSENDLNTLTMAIVEIVKNYDLYKQRAMQLREILLDEGYTWENQASQFINILRLLEKNGEELSTEQIGEESLQLWDRGSVITSWKSFIALEYLPMMCNSLLELDYAEYYSDFVKCVLVKFMPESNMRITILEAGNIDQNKGQTRGIDDGVVGIMRKINIDLMNKDQEFRGKAIFYEFQNNVCYSLEDDQKEKILDGYTNGGNQDSHVRAILAIPLIISNKLIGAVTLDFYNLKILGETGLEKKKIFKLLNRSMDMGKVLSTLILAEFIEEGENGNE